MTKRKKVLKHFYHVITNFENILQYICSLFGKLVHFSIAGKMVYNNETI
jgi:hypothetical protein